MKTTIKILFFSILFPAAIPSVLFSAERLNEKKNNSNSKILKIMTRHLKTKGVTTPLISLEKVDQMTPLMSAVTEHNIEEIGTLIDNNADVNEETEKGCTALILALKTGDPTIAQLLIVKNADVNHVSKRGGHPPLTAAVTGNHPDMVKLLIKNQANLNLSDENIKLSLKDKEATLLGLAKFHNNQKIIDLIKKMPTNKFESDN